MARLKRFFGASALGLLIGGSMAIAAPPSALNAGPGCKCDDWGDGDYQCTYEQTACVAGDEKCQVNCQG